MFEKIKSFFSSNKKINLDSLALFEEVLYESDVGINTAQKIIHEMKEVLSCHPRESGDPSFFKQIFFNMWLPKLTLLEKNIEIKEKPFVIFFVGVNGVGKTTTLAKVAHLFKTQGKKVLMVAADTFRAAAQEQLEQWSKKNGIPLFLKKEKRDPASIIFDSLEWAKKENDEVILVDTAGRFQTKDPLMEELRKMKRTSQKVIPNSPHEIWMIVDANTGHNIINQIKLFHENLGVTGVIVTKIDGTAKGGGLLTLAEEFSLPIVYLSTGEQLENLESFNAFHFLTKFIQ